MNSDILSIISFLYIIAILAAIIFGVKWFFGLLDLIVSSARLARAGARWLEAQTPTPPERENEKPRNIGPPTGEMKNPYSGL
jgi:hypothetical protein